MLAIVRAIHLLEEEGYAADYDDFTVESASMHHMRLSFGLGICEILGHENVL